MTDQKRAEARATAATDAAYAAGEDAAAATDAAYAAAEDAAADVLKPQHRDQPK